MGSTKRSIPKENLYDQQFRKFGESASDFGEKLDKKLKKSRLF